MDGQGFSDLTIRFSRHTVTRIRMVHSKLLGPTRVKQNHKDLILWRCRFPQASGSLSKPSLDINKGLGPGHKFMDDKLLSAQGDDDGHWLDFILTHDDGQRLLAEQLAGCVMDECEDDQDYEFQDKSGEYTQVVRQSLLEFKQFVKLAKGFTHPDRPLSTTPLRL